jgi:nitrite reductase/ring-hydroxylating ferredoxin subunit
VSFSWPFTRDTYTVELNFSFIVVFVANGHVFVHRDVCAFESCCTYNIYMILVVCLHVGKM